METILFILDIISIILSILTIGIILRTWNKPVFIKNEDN